MVRQDEEFPAEDGFDSVDPLDQFGLLWGCPPGILIMPETHRFISAYYI